MTLIHRTLLAAAVLLDAPLLHSQASESAIKKQLGNLRSFSADQRPAATLKLALDIRTLPRGFLEGQFGIQPRRPLDGRRSRP